MQSSYKTKKNQLNRDKKTWTVHKDDIQMMSIGQMYEHVGLHSQNEHQTIYTCVSLTGPIP